MQQRSLTRLLPLQVYIILISQLLQLNNYIFYSFNAQNTAYKPPKQQLPHQVTCCINSPQKPIIFFDPSAFPNTSTFRPLSLLAHLLSMELGQFLLVFGGGGALVLLVVQEFLHLLPVGGPQLLHRSPLIRLKLGLSLVERPQLLLKIPTHLLHLLKPRNIFYSLGNRLCVPASQGPTCAKPNAHSVSWKSLFNDWKSAKYGIRLCCQ